VGAIIDVMLIDNGQQAVIQRAYPKCIMRDMHDGEALPKRVRVIIPDEELEETYYNFLVDSQIASSSSNFVARLTSDAAFAERMKRRAALTTPKG
jgi:hypothetical protein